MMYWAIAYNDGTSYGIECYDVRFDTEHMRFVDVEGYPQDVVPYANVKIGTRITEDDYVSMLEKIGQEDINDG